MAALLKTIIGLNDPILTEESEAIYDKMININSTISLLSALILAFTYSMDNVTLDLSEGWPNPVCEGWIGYKADGSDLEYNDECSSCNNIWSSCELCEHLVQAYMSLMCLSMFLCTFSVIYCVGQLLNFSMIPKDQAKAYAETIGWRVQIGRVLMNLGLTCFLLGAAVKFSLTLTPAAFIASMVIVALAAGAYFYADSSSRASLHAKFLANGRVAVA
uniref:Uncharacterized protein n=1 Tax=Pyrodinium bahamense TaxID=73915 RepID=A0A7S0BD25_9DINO